MKFLDFWSHPDHCPDIITGWNVRFFDIPYLVIRVTNVLGVDFSKKFSPWGMIDYRQITRRGKQEDVYDIKGIQVLHYLEL